MDNDNLKTLPVRIKDYLNKRGISDIVIDSRKISYDGKRIVIPIFDADGVKIFNKYRRDPDDDSAGPKYTYDKGAKSALYNIDLLKLNPLWWNESIIICEGELDALILLSNNFRAVTSTGGAGTFLPEWAKFFENKKTFVCFDNDPAGRKGLVNVISHIPHARCIPLPAEVKDVTDYFVLLNKTHEDFQFLIDHASFEIEVPKFEMQKPKKIRTPDQQSDNDFARAKCYPISEYLKVNADGFASCPFHKEKTASMKVDKNNRFYCFGCSKWGDVIDIVKQIYNLETIRDAVNYILKK